MEMALGQFTSRGSVKMWQMVPVLKGFIFVNDSLILFLKYFFPQGVGIGQMVATTCVLTYYCSLIALTLFYMFKSFASELPWAKCWSSWDEACIDSSSLEPRSNLSADARSSSEIYFL